MTIVATGHKTEFVYDGLGRRVQILEKDPDATQTLQTTSDKKYLWVGTEIAEQRSGEDGGTVQKRFFAQGFVDSDGTILLYTRDHLGSIRELVDMSQTVRARYDYDPYGNVTKVSGDRDSDFLYTGHYYHGQSGLFLTLFRAYDPELGRWISRDPAAEYGGINLYQYCFNNPVMMVDPDGRFPIIPVVTTLVGAVAGGVIAYANGGSFGDVVSGALWGAAAGLAFGLMAEGVPLLGIADQLLFGGVGTFALGMIRNARYGMARMCPIGTGGMPPPSAYSVAYQAQLPSGSYPGVSRPRHNQLANEQLLQAMEGSPSFGNTMNSLGISLSRTSTGLAPRTAPDGWVWHHEQSVGTVSLVPSLQHRPQSPYWRVLHPDGSGGYSKWGN